ncbi:Ig domain-containing protein [Frankia sp. Cppng1_Ct_nod]|uniref:Ig domain-containing protein n=1 Tax=Frankia sp. Cppng1_Ct_nod TaxID=2897162 RepID=UPI0010418B48|nr:Ig domain-containing protein [Frankia sp. Cppng1_Ct_nod]
MPAFIDILETLTVKVLQALDSLFKLFVSLMRVIADHLADVLDHPLPAGPLNTLYRWIQTESEIADPEDVTLGGLVFLIAGFAVTTSYKLIHGVDQAPFPGGRFPAIPAPPWHSAYDPSQELETVPDPEMNARMQGLQGVCGFCGLFGGFFDLAADLVPAVGAGTLPKGLDAFVAAGSTILTGFMFGAVTSCPPVTGTSWSAAGGKWSQAFLVSCMSVLASAGAIFADRKDDADTSILRNTGKVVIGPITVGTLSVAYMILCGLASDIDGTNPYTEAQILLSALPGGFQFLRIGIGKGSLMRAGAVAALDVVSTEASALMLIVAALTEGPAVDKSQKLPKGKIGSPYSTPIKATGGTHPYNQPLKDWQIRTGSLPPGLRLDAKTGVISGIPTTAGTSSFSVWCSDSYGPPQFSKPVTLSIQTEA